MPGGATALKNEPWHTWTITIGFQSLGLWRAEEDGTDINAVDRSHGKVKGSMLIARADDFGKVGLYRYPCPEGPRDGSNSRDHKGHSSHVTCCRFNENDTYLYSTGGEDHCVMQWKVVQI